MRLWILATASGVLALSLTSQALAGAFEIGQAAAQSGDYATAARLWTPLAQNGDSDAQYNLGVLYDQGQGVRRDPAHAARLFHQAAQGGVVDAEVNLGIHYAEGDGVPRDPVQADRWFHKAAAAGSQIAAANLALLHGRPAPQSAVETSSKAAAGAAPTPTRTSTVETAEAAPAFAPPPMDSAAAGAFATPSAQPQVALAPPAARPRSTPASPRPSTAPVDASRAHWAQIGAFSDQRAAQQRWSEIERRLPRETDGRSYRIERVAHGGGTLVRALTGPFDSVAAAEAFCRKLSAISGECFPTSGPPPFTLR